MTCSDPAGADDHHHAYTNDQRIWTWPTGSPPSPRPGIIPTTGRQGGCSDPELKGKFDGYALRVPTSTVSVVDFTAIVERPTTKESERCLQAASEAP